MKVFGAKGNHYPKRYYKGEILDEKSGVSCLADTGYISRGKPEIIFKIKITSIFNLLEQYEEMSDEQKKKYVLLNDQPASSICKVESLTGFHNFQPCFQQDMIVLPAGLNHNNQNGQRGGFGQKSRRGRGGQHGGQMHNHHNQQMGYNNAPTQ